MDSTKSMRVLTRPPASDAAQSSSSHSQPRSPEGVVVVGFVSRSPVHCSHLLNRVLDSNSFGLGNAPELLSADNEELIDWFKWRRISFYHEQEKGILYLQFCSTQCPAVHCSSDSGSCLASDLEDRQFEDLQGLLFMFSVCHVIIYIQEGSRFNPHILKKFRVLQAAKHALAPFVRSRNTPPLPSKPHSSTSSRPSLSTSSPPRRGGGAMSRSASAISLMLGLGSSTSLFPGNCTPVILFVFVDDFFDVPKPITNIEESKDAPPLNHSSSSSSVSRPSLPTKGSGPVVVLARPSGKSEGGFRKKLQSSLEAQIRFLIKKCRTLSGSESGHLGSRSAGAPNSAPLFSLDASRAVVLLDRFVYQRCEALEFVTDLVEDICNGKATSDSLLLENHQGVNREDVLSVKEFIYRQSDILRGRGGLAASTNSGPAAGVGMVAAAAAAAAASAASKKTINAVELPNLEIWLSTSQVLLQGILSAKCGCIEEIEAGKRKPRQRNPLQVEGYAPRGMDPLDVAVSLLGSGRGINMKFSTLWCERSLPTAKDVYLKGLPDCYPTSQHKAHLEKALHAFHSMVRGPVVPIFAKKLEDECKSIWKSGRQLCDAVSLTGKPCMHRKHDIQNGELEASVKPHSSGYYFLHACACGRSRRLRSDPFDFESANVSFNFFPECDKLLPALRLPEQSSAGPVKSSSWNLVRIGGAQYYKPSKGLLQSGFSVSEKFLYKWTIVLEKPVKASGPPAKSVQQGRVAQQGLDPQVDVNTGIDNKKIGDTQLNSGVIQVEFGNQKKLLVNSKISDKKLGFGRGVPNFAMKKPFSEVVAGSSSIDSAFPPLQQKKQPSSGSERGVKQNRAEDNSSEQIFTTTDQGSQKSEGVIPVQELFVDNQSVEIGSNAGPMNINDGQMVKLNLTSKQAVVYVGFEHECPMGHRFLLSTEHINELGSPYSLSEDYQGTHVETSYRSLVDSSNLGRNGVHHKIHRNSKGTTVLTANKVRNVDKIKHMGKNVVLSFDGVRQFSSSGKEQNQMYVTDPVDQDSLKNLEADLSSISLDDGGSAFSMLNRNLPIYMNCPYCRHPKTKKDLQKINYAGSVSQLQRIIVVTPPFPIVLGTCPIVQFEASCLPPSVGDREENLQFSFGCRVLLPPESFVTLRLPFVYGVQLEDGSSRPLSAFENRPEMSAWLVKGTALQIISKGSVNDGTQT